MAYRVSCWLQRWSRYVVDVKQNISVVAANFVASNHPFRFLFDAPIFPEWWSDIVIEPDYGHCTTSAEFG